MTLGGSPVLGRFIIASIEPQDEEEFTRVNEKLNKARAYLNKTRAKKSISNAACSGLGLGPQLVQAPTTSRFYRISEGKPRMAHWRDKVMGSNIEDTRVTIDDANVDFLWRPYSTSENFKFYLKELWVSISPDMHEDCMCFAKFVTVYELVWLNCGEPYFPHCVSKKFGMGQNIPG